MFPERTPFLFFFVFFCKSKGGGHTAHGGSCGSVPTSGPNSRINSSGTNVLASRSRSHQRHPRRLLLEESSVAEQLWLLLGDGTEGPAAFGSKERGVELAS